MEINEEISWYEEIQERLRQRDDLQSRPFSNLIETVNEYAGRMDSILLAQESLRAALKRARQQQNQTTNNNNTTTTAVNPELTIKLSQLREERAELYRQQGQHVQRILDLNEQLKDRDTRQKSLKEELEAAREEILRLQGRVGEWERLVEEKNINIQIVQDELVAMQLELLKLDEEQKKQSKTKEVIEGNEFVFTLKMDKEIQAPHQYPITTSAASGQGNVLATGSEDQKIILYDLTRISTKAVLKWQENGPIRSLAFDFEGTLLASVSAYSMDEVVIWGLPGGKVKTSLSLGKSNDSGNNKVTLTFGRNGRLWTGSGDQVKLWDPLRTLCLRTIKNLPGRVNELIVDESRPDRVWCFLEDSVSLIDGGSGRIERVILYQELLGLSIIDLILGYDDQRIVIVAGNELFILIMQPTLSLKSKHPLPFKVTSIAMNPTGTQLILASETGSIYPIILEPVFKIGEEIKGHAGSAVQNIYWSMDNSGEGRIVSVSGEDRRIRLWSISNS